MTYLESKALALGCPAKAEANDDTEPIPILKTKPWHWNIGNRCQTK
jgi:hypothetical protein